MQSFDTETDNTPAHGSASQTLTVGATGDLPPGACIRVELPDGAELAVYNVNGEYYATDNFCPHKGAPLSEGLLCGHVVECGWHGWQFDVRSGECLTVRERIRSFRVSVENDQIKVEL
jgi:nitrite reductase (NADH) small subunit/3-phenylpropionate/trans-cinnamate dioxygenase ferredoxin subunit